MPGPLVARAGRRKALHKFAQGNLRVDFHTHFIPEHLPAMGEKYSDEGWPTLIHNAPCQADIYFAGKHYRRIDDRSWDLQRRRDTLNPLEGDKLLSIGGSMTIFPQEPHEAS